MNDIFNLTGRVAIVTGASSGLGVQFSKILAAKGAMVVLCARRKDKLDKVEAEIKSAGGQAVSMECDVGNEEAINNTVARVLEEYKKIDILINNAGTSEIAPAENMTSEQWDKVLNINLKSVFTFSRAVAKPMIAAKYGKIVNISSIFGLVGNNTFPVVNYHASKHGVIGLTRALAAEWAKYNITVNAICPGFFESEMTESAIHTEKFNKYLLSFCPMQRNGAEGELDGAILLLCSDASSYITGQSLAVDGGWVSI